MEWKLSAGETAGVVGVGVVLALGANAIANAAKTPDSHKLAMLAGGAALYTAGVVIGANRPPAGFLPVKM